MHIRHGVFPSLTGVSINFPAARFLGGCPVGDLEALEHGTGLSVETDISDTLEEGIGMEVLSVNVMHDVWLLVEFISIDVLNAQTCFSGLFDVELVGHSKDVGVAELDSIGNVLFNTSAGVENELDPALTTLVSDVVLEGSSYLPFAEVSSVNELIDQRFLHSWHVFDF